MNKVWRFAAKDMIVLLRQYDDRIEYACGGLTPKLINGQIKRYGLPIVNSDAALDAVLAFVSDYFNLSVKLVQLYDQWTAVERKHLVSGTSCFSRFPGIRILRQDPWETVVLFICSSNNNVKRISKMCDALCEEYGDLVAELEGAAYHSFPGPEKLCAPDVEDRLRELGFGYRAKYIQQTAALFVSDDTPEITLDSLRALRKTSYEDAHQYLLRLVGVGPKVADCICLMSLDKHDIVPVDTHVLQIAVRDYQFKKPKVMNAKLYHEVREHLRRLFGEYAGWAQLVMFAADLSDLNNGVNSINGRKVKHEIVDVNIKLDPKDDSIKFTRCQISKKEEDALLINEELTAGILKESKELMNEENVRVRVLKHTKSKRTKPVNQLAKRVKMEA